MTVSVMLQSSSKNEIGYNETSSFLFHRLFPSHIADYLSVVLITEMLEICMQISYDQNVQLILKSYLPVVYGTTLIKWNFSGTCNLFIIAKLKYNQTWYIPEGVDGNNLWNKKEDVSL
jgi:hypothetical protein